MKALVAAYGPAIGSATGIFSLLLGIANWMRTGRVNTRVHSNNRASRFEAAYGPSLNDTVAKLKDVTRVIAATRTSLQSVDDAQKFARETLQPGIASIENIFVNEVALVADSDLSNAKELWSAAIDQKIWDAASDSVAALLTAKSIDIIPGKIDALQVTLNDALKKIQTARDRENSIT